MITATVVAGSVAKQLNLGSIVALLVVGMALGPHSPRPLLTGHIEELQTVGEIGVILLLFLVGLETQPGKLSSMRRLFFGLGTAQYLLTAIAIAGTSDCSRTRPLAVGPHSGPRSCHEFRRDRHRKPGGACRNCKPAEPRSHGRGDLSVLHDHTGAGDDPTSRRGPDCKVRNAKGV